MRVVIAPDSFKGSAEAPVVAAQLAAGWRSVRPGDTIEERPMADGGEGTMDALKAAVPDAVRMPVAVHGPDDRAVDTRWLLLPNASRTGGDVGVVELAAASGITLLDRLRPLTAHTVGFGEAIVAALEHGVDSLLLAIGGSASTDGGTGALAALGARFLDRSGAPVAAGGAGLAEIATVDFGALRALPPGGARILSDVTNPLTGPRGAAAVFGAQKGADAPTRAALDDALRHLATVAAGEGLAARPGAGAAGGTGFGLLLWGADLVAGAAAVGDAMALPAAVAGADAVITGEGRFDGQTADGKVPGYVAGLARSGRMLLVAGGIEAEPAGFDDAVSLTDLGGSVEAAMAEPARLLREAGAELARRIRP